MSRYRGNDEKCPHCGIKYRDFHTGLRYVDVYCWMMDNETDPSKWRYKRRHTILGKWHQHKMEMWKFHTERGCEKFYPVEVEMDLASGDVPF